MNCSRRHPRVRLGPHWRLFSAKRPGLTMLGTIQSGLEIGALALAGKDLYVQVNGSIVRELPTARVKAAIERARQAQLDGLAMPSPPPSVAPPVVSTESLAAPPSGHNCRMSDGALPLPAALSETTPQANRTP